MCVCVYRGSHAVGLSVWSISALFAVFFPPFLVSTSFSDAENEHNYSCKWTLHNSYTFNIYILGVIVRHACWIVGGERLGPTHTLSSVKMHLVMALHTCIHTCTHPSLFPVLLICTLNCWMNTLYVLCWQKKSSIINGSFGRDYQLFKQPLTEERFLVLQEAERHKSCLWL